MYKLNTFTDRASLDTNFADQVSQLLADAIANKGQASLAVSGGSTPKGFFNALSQRDIDWSKVTVTLADERWVDETDSASNTQLVKQNLLINNASAATFFELKRGDNLDDVVLTELCVDAKSILPLDVLILGMGEDGHTASLFPCSDQIVQALSADAPAIIKTEPKTAPHQRVTFSYAALSESKSVFLHIVGAGKKVVLEEALRDINNATMPIRAFLHHPSLKTDIYWAE